MSTLKEKPLKKCHTDSRQMIDEIHNDIKNELDRDSLHDYYLDNGVLLDQYYKISTERKMNNDNTGILHYFNKDTTTSNNSERTTNKEWWPNQLRINILHQHDKRSNPLKIDHDSHFQEYIEKHIQLLQDQVQLDKSRQKN